MKPLNDKKILRWLRIIHRDLGFLMVGVCLIYGISGFLLNRIHQKDFAFKTEAKSVQLESGLSKDELTVNWNDQKGLPKLKKVLAIDDEHHRLMLEGGIGVYNIKSGYTDYELNSKRAFIYWINRLHYNKVTGWNYMADFFAFSLVFFAISGIFMVKGKKGMAGSGKWWLLGGLLIPLVYILIQ